MEDVDLEKSSLLHQTALILNGEALAQAGVFPPACAMV